MAQVQLEIKKKFPRQHEKDLKAILKKVTEGDSKKK